MQPYNDNILIEKVKEEAVSDSGIYTGQDKVEKFVVVKGEDKLIGKEVFLKEMPVYIKGDIYATPIDNVVAYASS